MISVLPADEEDESELSALTYSRATGYVLGESRKRYHEPIGKDAQQHIPMHPGGVGTMGHTPTPSRFGATFTAGGGGGQLEGAGGLQTHTYMV